jgi:hypothetical protein
VSPGFAGCWPVRKRFCLVGVARAFGGHLLHPLAFAPIKHAFSVKLCSEWFMSSSFHNADRRTYRKVMLVGLLFCAAFVVFSFFAREQPANTYVLKKADRLVRSAGSAVPAN